MWVHILPHVVHVANDVEEAALDARLNLGKVGGRVVHVMTLPVRCERTFEGRVDTGMHTANSQVVLVGAQVLSNLRLVLLLVGDLNAEQDLKAIAEFPA